MEMKLAIVLEYFRFLGAAASPAATAIETRSRALVDPEIPATRRTEGGVEVGVDLGYARTLVTGLGRIRVCFCAGLYAAEICGDGRRLLALVLVLSRRRDE